MIKDVELNKYVLELSNHLTLATPRGPLWGVARVR